MNNEWNSEVVTDVNESDITVDQLYDATSSNPQSGTAVAQAVAQAGGTVDQTYNASSANAQSGTAVAGAIAGVKQVPASTSADADKVLTVNSEGVPGWATAQGGGGGSSVEAGAGLLKSGDTLSVDAGNGLQLGSRTAGQSNGSSYSTVPGSAISGIGIISCGDVYDHYFPSSLVAPEKAYIFVADYHDTHTVYGRYTGVEFDVTQEGSNLIVPGVKGLHTVDFKAENFVMNDGHTFSELEALSTAEVVVGFSLEENKITGLERSRPVLFDGTSLQLTTPVPAANASIRRQVLTVGNDGSIGWEKSVFNPVYAPGSTKPTFSVSNNIMTIIARNGSTSVNAPFINDVSGIVSDGGYNINRLVLVSPVFSIESDSTKSGTRVTLKTTYHFAKIYAYTGEFDMVFFDAGVRGASSVGFNCTHNLYMYTSTSQPAIQYIRYELVDDEGNTVAFAASNQLTSYTMATHRLPI